MKTSSKLLSLTQASLLLALSGYCLLTVTGCAQEANAQPAAKEAMAESSAVAAPAPAPPEAQGGKPFDVPENGLLTEKQVERFVVAHQAMVKVNEVYLDSLAAAPAQNQKQIYQAMDIAKDKVSRKYGLRGFKEYRWILEEAPRKPENVTLLERHKVSVVSGNP